MDPILLGFQPIGKRSDLLFAVTKTKFNLWAKEMIDPAKRAGKHQKQQLQRMKPHFCRSIVATGSMRVYLASRLRLQPAAGG